MPRISKVVNLAQRYAPPISPDDLAGAGTFWIVGARVVQTRYGERVVCDVILDPSGERYSVFLGVTDARLQIVDHFRNANAESIGPCVLTKPGRAWLILDAESTPVPEESESAEVPF